MTTASSAADFKARKQGITLDLPSGLTVVARRASLQSFLKKGDVANPLMPLIEESLKKGKEVDPAKLMSKDGSDEGVDVDKVNEMFELVNEVCMGSVVTPELHPELKDGEVEDPEIVYISDVDEEDRMFIFQWAIGGTTDLATFRAEAQAGLDALAEGKDAPRTAKRAPRPRK